MRADALEMYARLMIRRLRPAVFIKMLLYHFIGKFLVASRPKRHRLAQIYLLRLGAGCRDSFSSPRCFSTAMRINPMTLTKKDQSSKLPATGEGANDDPHAASPP